MSQVAVPVASVVATHVSDPLSVKVTGSLTIGVPVFGLVNTAETGVGVEKFPVTGLIVSEVGSGATGAAVAASSSPTTDSPLRKGEFVEIVCMTCPVAMFTCQMSPEKASSVQ